MLWPQLQQAGDGGILLLHHQENGLSYGFLECHNTVNTIGAEDAELAFVITAKVDEAATTLTSAG